jgi:ribosome-associated protein
VIILHEKMPSKIENRPFEQEFDFKASLSGGPGGQHVNKVSTSVELRFNVQASQLLSEEEKQLVLKKLKNKINKEGELIIVSRSSRSQAKNKDKAIEKFYKLVATALKKPKKRVPTKPSKASKEKRLEEKKKHAEKKAKRKPPLQ